jgi:segregation and condensation protein A
MEYQVKLDQFEGPLDLLLYLIKEMKISIDDINVSKITEQYIQFIHQMEKLNLEIASEYLVMAAHLVYIKSKMMLPKVKQEDDHIVYEENPEEKLKMRLKVYKMFKDVIPLFQAYEEERSHYLTKIPTDLSNDFKLEAKEILNKHAEVSDLLAAFNRVLRRYNLHKPLKTKIEHQTITIEERINQVKGFLLKKGHACFTDLWNNESTKEYVVVTFLAILELAKESVVKLSQDELFDSILINYVGEESRGEYEQ